MHQRKVKNSSSGFIIVHEQGRFAVNLLPKVQKHKATEFNSTQIHTSTESLQMRFFPLRTVASAVLVSTALSHHPHAQLQSFFLQSLPLWFWPLIGDTALVKHTHTHWTCRLRSGRNMTRSQFINLAHWRNTKSSHSWGEREKEKRTEWRVWLMESRNKKN